MLVAQSLGEYGAGGMGAEIVASIDSLVQWLQLSLREHSGAWAATALCLVFAFWFFRRS